MGRFAYFDGRLVIDKIVPSMAYALRGVRDEATILIGGFGTAGIPREPIEGLIAQRARSRWSTKHTEPRHRNPA